METFIVYIHFVVGKETMATASLSPNKEQQCVSTSQHSHLSGH